MPLRGEDSGQWGHSMANFAEIMFPVLEAAGVRSLAEIGAYAGVLTAALLEWAEPAGARVIAVDPSPQAELLALAREREQLQLEQATSVEAIPAMDLPDAFIIDGDHNYFTVSEELRLIADRVAATSAAMPLLLFHDVCWPHARRDTYYAPDRIPEDYLSTMVEGVGIFPDEPGITWGGLPYKYAQKHEGGDRNGVLTAVEDFVCRASRARAGDRPDLLRVRSLLVEGRPLCRIRPSRDRALGPESDAGTAGMESRSPPGRGLPGADTRRGLQGALPPSGEAAAGSRGIGRASASRAADAIPAEGESGPSGADRDRARGRSERTDLAPDVRAR